MRSKTGQSQTLKDSRALLRGLSFIPRMMVESQQGIIQLEMSVGLLKRNTGLMPSSCGLEEPVNITRKRLGPGTPKASVTVKHSSDGDSVKHFDLLTALFCLDFNTSQGLVSSGLICGNFCSYTVEKAMAPHSSTLAGKSQDRKSVV